MTPTAHVTVQHTLLDLDLNHPLIARSLLDPHEMHRTVMSAFRHWIPDGTPNPRAQMGVLHTHATNLNTNRLTLIVQSRVPGDWTALPRNALTAPPDTRTITLHITPGQRHRFRTVINPARYTTPPGPPRPRNRNAPADTSPDAALTWFTSRLQPPGHPDYDRWPRIGATADPTELTARPLPGLASHTAHPGMKINRAEITGHLTITDPHTYAKTLTHGIGRSRAYGCGLLLTQPLKNQQSPSNTPAHEGATPHVRG
ncbi:type I-E CRISPR-associated protein Cas6/Cse3/CasE [Streptomyces chrestomyceticus]|uniref:type I-E CRISPR-associated protein Cas6/Cse3/CasE n=1 Tax=Streptomyces chrestomyceticus TaxID=68185 RepID=UPI00379BF505